jgi:ABC-2 type transport system permease protein
LISAFRWSFYGLADVSVGLSAAMILLFLAGCMLVVRWIFKSGYRLRP